MNKENIIKENEWIVYLIAHKYKKYYNMEDLYQSGFLGLIDAYDHFDFNSNSKFSSYAYKYVLGQIISYIKNNRLIKVSDEYFYIYKQYIKIKELLFNKYSREPTLKEVSNMMEIDERILLRVVESTLFEKTIEYEFENECVIDERENIDKKILLDIELEKLNEFDRELIKHRYYNGYSQNETAVILGTNQVKVSREESMILKRMKNSITNKK